MSAQSENSMENGLEATAADEALKIYNNGCKLATFTKMVRTWLQM